MFVCADWCSMNLHSAHEEGWWASVILGKGSHGTCPSPKLASGKWDTQAICPSLPHTEPTRQLSVMQQLHVKERSESSNLSLGFPVSWAKPGGTTRHLSQFRRSVFNVSHAHLQPKIIATIKTMLWEWFQNCCLIWKWKTKANKLRQC